MVLELFCLVVMSAVESVWSGVVTGTQAAVLPAYQPRFQPVPLLHTTSNIEVVCPSTPPSKHSQSPSSQVSREGVSSEQHGTGNICDPRHLFLAPRCPATDCSLQREESSDSGGVFLTPTSCSHAGLSLDSEDGTVSRNSRSSSIDLPVPSLVNVGRTFGNKLSDNTNVEYHPKDFATGLRENGSQGDFQPVRDAAEMSANEQSANDLSDAVHVHRNSCYAVLYHRSDEAFVTPSKTKKKTKKSRRNSQPGQTNCLSAERMVVYGGNPKWIWKS